MILGLRSVEQRASDRLLLLWLINEASPLDRFKLQKLPFREEYELDKEGKRLFNYEFFQYDRGPISVDIYDDLDALKELKLISEEGVTIRSSSEGKNLLANFQEVFRSNESLLTRVSGSIRDMSKKNSYDLVRETHDMLVTFGGKDQKLREIPKFTTFLIPPESTSFEVDERSLETLIVLCNPELMANMRKVRREGSNSSPYIPLVSA